jgi:hypothetical protein
MTPGNSPKHSQFEVTKVLLVFYQGSIEAASLATKDNHVATNLDVWAKLTGF